VFLHPSRSAELSAARLIIISQINCNQQTAAFWRCELIHTLLKASYMINKQHAVAGNAFNAVCAAI